MIIRGIALLITLQTALHGGEAPPPQSARSIVTTTHPNGQVKERYSVDGDGKKSGPSTEYYENGATKVEAVYEAGALHGPYKVYFESGRVCVTASYRAGRRHGPFAEYEEKGAPVRKASYRDGKLHGTVEDYLNGKLVRQQVWENGALLYPKSLDGIAAALRAIKAAEVPWVGTKPENPAPPKSREQAAKATAGNAKLAQRVDAVRAIMCYRFLCDVPHEGMALDADYTAAAQAGAELLAKIGRLDHTPPNPGLPEQQYKLAYRGTSHSNLSGGSSMVGAVTSFMNDSDHGNIDRVGHRRWLLNPRMLKTGLGAEGAYVALWSMDTSRTDAPDYDFVAYPARGFMPRSHFSPDYAWSVSLNPAKYATPDKASVAVAVYPVDATLARAKGPLALNYFNVSGPSFGEGAAIIFRPDRLQFAPRSRYRVEIKGVKKRVDTAADLEYVVAFVDLPAK